MVAEPARLPAASSQRAPRAPGHLKEAGRAVWRDLAGVYAFEGHHLAILQAACEAADRSAEARAAIERDGAYVAGTPRRPGTSPPPWPASYDAGGDPVYPCTANVGNALPMKGLAAQTPPNGREVQGPRELRQRDAQPGRLVVALCQWRARPTDGCNRAQKGLGPVKRAVVSLLAAVFLAAIAVVPVGAARATAFFGISPVCYNTGWDGLRVYINWSGQTPAAGDLVVTLDFNAKKTTQSLELTYVAPVQASAYSPTIFQKFQLVGLTDWNTITSLSASTTGAFTDSARTVRQPHGGWSVCP